MLRDRVIIEEAEKQSKVRGKINLRVKKGFLVNSAQSYRGCKCNSRKLRASL